MTPYKSLPPASKGQWSLLLLRLFLGVTFVYAGIQKLNDSAEFVKRFV